MMGHLHEIGTTMAYLGDQEAKRKGKMQFLEISVRHLSSTVMERDARKAEAEKEKKLHQAAEKRVKIAEGKAAQAVEEAAANMRLLARATDHITKLKDGNQILLEEQARTRVKDEELKAVIESLRTKVRKLQEEATKIPGETVQRFLVSSVFKNTACVLMLDMVSYGIN